MINLLNNDNIYIVTLKSEKGNMLTKRDLVELIDIVDKAELQNEIKGLIITGNRNSFCTGVALSKSEELCTKEQINETFQLLDLLLLKLFSFKKPFIAAVNGHSIGGGFLIMLCADYIFVTDSLNTKYGLPEVNLGLSLDQIMVQIALFSLSANKMKEIICKGELFDVEILKDLGIIDKLEQSELLINYSLNFLLEIIKKKERAFIFTKEQLRKQKNLQLQELFSKECYTELTELYLATKNND